MHIGKQKLFCPELNVHEEKMKRTKNEKYLGNIITDDGSTKINKKKNINRLWYYCKYTVNFKRNSIWKIQVGSCFKIKRSNAHKWNHD